MSVSVPIPCGFYHYCFVVEFEVRDGDSIRSSLIVENSFRYSGLVVVVVVVTVFVVVPKELENCSFYLAEVWSCNFDGDCIESLDYFW